MLFNGLAVKSAEASLQRMALQRNKTFVKTLEDKGLEYFRIKNWDRYQGIAKKKNQVFSWIRLDSSVLDDPKTYDMSALNFAIWVKLLLIARKFDNQVALDLRWIAHNMRFRARNWRKNIAYFEDLGLIEVFSGPPQTDTTDRQTDRENSEGALKGAPSGPAAPPKTNKEFTEALKKIGVLE